MKLAAILSCSVIVFSGCTTTPSSPKQCRFSVLHTNDTHGHPLRFDNFPAKNVGGIPARTSLIEGIKRQGEPLLLLDAGDINTGRPESNFFDAEPDIEGFNAAGYDAVTLGNHEFDKPLNVLQKQIASARFSFLSANVKLKNGGVIPGTKAWMIKEVGGCRVAVFGLLNHTTESSITPENAEKIYIENEYSVAKKIVPELRKHADAVIALVHMGLEDDDGGSQKLAREVSGIDLIVDGHSHSDLREPVVVSSPNGRKVSIVQVGEWGLRLGHVRMTGNAERGFETSFESLAVDSKVIEDEIINAKLQPYAKRVDEKLSEVVGSAPEALGIENVRNAETPVANLVADAMFQAASRFRPDFAILNAGSIRVGLPAGKISLKHIFETLPYDNSIVLVTLSGSEVLELFDNAASVPVGKGGFPAVAGVKVQLNRQAKKSFNVLVDGAPVDKNRTYRVVTHAYLAGGGDGYAAFKKAQSKFDTSIFLRDALVDYSRKNKLLKGIVEGRITLL
jgi:5'-nucleotidase/UDP-sugar diphosphatase